MQYEVVRQIDVETEEAAEGIGPWQPGSTVTLVSFEDDTFALVSTLAAETLEEGEPATAVFASSPEGRVVMTSPLDMLMGPQPLWIGDSQEQFLEFVADFDYEAALAEAQAEAEQQGFGGEELSA